MEIDRIDKLVIFQMEMIIKRYRQIAMQTLKKYNAGVTLDQWIVLKQISENNGTSQVEIGKSTIKDAPTTTRIIDQLSNKKLIIKQLDPDDRRRYMVFATEKGQKVIDRMLPYVRTYRDQSLKNFSNMEIVQLEQLLTRIISNLNTKNL